MPLKRLAGLIGVIAALVSLYMFSRFTVDDAFISWRYGKNLVDAGVWAFNPTSFDATQAYTNPIYAVLSIIPNMFGWDVVLFFKLISIGSLVGFIFWARKTLAGSGLLTIAFIALPATMIHIFAGLETFVFVFALAALLISLHERRPASSVLLALLLFVTRPEAWALVILVPGYFLFSDGAASVDGPLWNRLWRFITSLRLTAKRGILVTAALVLPLSAYFIFHRLHFGYALPNTFYVKANDGFNAVVFFSFGFFLIPAIALLFTRYIKMAGFMLALFGAMLLSYSTSSLSMNYAERFCYHIFAPCFIYFVYLTSRLQGNVFVALTSDFSNATVVPRKLLAKWCLFGYLLVFAALSNSALTDIGLYYPRLLNAHVALGKTLSSVAGKYSIRAFSISDAGAVPYHAGITTLDNIGLGSSLVAHQGISAELLDQYQLDVVVFRGDSDGIRLGKHNQQILYDWALAQGFTQQCNIYWKEEYILMVYSRSPLPELSELCAASEKANKKTNRQLRKPYINTPPWRFWHE